MEKGTYGYIRRYRKKQIFYVIILGIVIITGVALSIGLYHTTKTMLILLPILTSLPFAKQLVGLILCADMVPLTEEEYRKVTEEISYGKKSGILYDLSISQYEGILFFPAVIVRDGRLLFLYRGKWGKRFSSKEALKKYLKTILETEKHPYVILVATDIDEFINKAGQIKEPDEETGKRDAGMRKRLFELGI